MAVMAVAVTDTGREGEFTQWVKVLGFDDKAATAATLDKGSRVYCEGMVKLEQWTTREGEARAGLTVLANMVQPVGRIGRRKPKGTQAQHQAAARSQAPLGDPGPQDAMPEWMR